MKIKNDNILFIVRSYNEGIHLTNTIKGIQKEGFNKILVVDDGSTDNTEENVKGLNIFYIKHLINRGGGAAAETGFEFARRFYKKYNFSYIVTFDADGQHNIKDIYNFIQEFEKDNKLEVVLGSRFIKNTAYNIPLTRKIVLFLGNIFTFFVSKIKVSDPHNGYRMLSINSVEKIKLNIDNFAYSSQIIDIIAEKKIKFKEVPVNIIYTEYSLSKGQKSSNAINIAFRMIYEKFFK